MYETIKAFAIKAHASFRSSATILVARINVAVGVLFEVVLQMDPHQVADLVPQLQNPKYLAAWIMINGFLTEYARRRPGSQGPLSPVTPYRPTSNPLQ